MGTYKLNDLFVITGTKSLDEGKLEFISEGIHFVGRVSENNGVKGMIARQAFSPNEANTITATVIGNYKYVKYQTKAYYTSQNINKLVPKQQLSKQSIYYLITYIQQFVSRYDGQQGGYKLDELNDFTISIPTKNKQPDYTFMSDFIRAVEKLVIKDLVQWLDKEIVATKEVVADH